MLLIETVFEYKTSLSICTRPWLVLISSCLSHSSGVGELLYLYGGTEREGAASCAEGLYLFNTSE